MLVLSTDLGTFFSGTQVKEANTQTVEKEEKGNVFQFAYLQHNLGCITNAIRCAVSTKTEKATNSFADKYTNAVAKATTDTVEKAIVKKDGIQNTKTEKE